MSNYDTIEEEKKAIEEFSKIRKNLITVRSEDDCRYKKEIPSQQSQDCQSPIRSTFEADYQLAALIRQGIVDYVQTSDSDLNVLGAKNISLRFKGERANVG